MASQRKTPRCLTHPQFYELCRVIEGLEKNRNPLTWERMADELAARKLINIEMRELVSYASMRRACETVGRPDLLNRNSRNTSAGNAIKELEGRITSLSLEIQELSDRLEKLEGGA